ncbi:TPA: hypothetical protein N0F65_011190 [Lagenidium giganteum]|uniref:Retrovirus-related Pol polyprotein from transposon TNT 1-94-like beta-barrel domain-containing protein n=1 Tax=Lagenidium giganteum TaxID=4803 RepID=A0AAV2Z596_9STRA|nr:TPA: hypothetical protein N0F65_011190 [Lagenidium giganteum]
MSPWVEDFVAYKNLGKGIEVIITDGANKKAVGVGDMVIKCPNGKRVTVTNSLHIPNLDSRFVKVNAISLREAVKVNAISNE